MPPHFGCKLVSAGLSGQTAAACVTSPQEDPTLASDKLPPGVGQRWRERDALCFALSAAGSGEAQPAARQ